MINLSLFHRLAASTGSMTYDNIMRHATGWQRTTRALGGYWLGNFSVNAEDGLTANDLIDFFTTHIGNRIVEKTAGIVTWEGEISQMDLTLDGVTYRRTLDTEYWHNKVKVSYTDNATGNATATAWAENESSSELYGEGCYIDVVGNNYDATAATAARDRRLTENAFPKPLPASGMAFGMGAEQDGLQVYCSGFVLSMNRRYRESDTAAAAISTQISTLVGESEFVTAGSIESNSMSVPISCAEIPSRLWDVVEDMILMGDTSGNRWIGGVYNERRFNYKLAETEITHYWRGGTLVDRAGVPVIPSLVKPNIIVQVSSAPVGTLPPGGNVFDNPKNIYVEEVEFQAPNMYRLIPHSEA